MNIIEGEYQNGTITFANGYSVQMPEAFAAKHDAYYREKIAELEAVLEMDDFKKMHALKLIDKDLFALHSQLEPALVGRALKDVIASAHHVNEECAAKVEALIGKFVENEATLASELAEAHKINARELIVALKEIVSTIGDEHGKEALEALNALAEIESQGMGSKESLTTYTAFVQAVEELIAYASTVDSHILQTKCAALNVAGQVDKTSKQWLLTVRKPLLTFEKIPSSVIGKLHNAQVFNKNEKEEKGTLYYQKPKKEKKKHAVKFNLNSVDVEFVNNLYDVACDLLAKCNAALSGKHGVRLGIRPEDLHLSSEFAGDSTQGFKVNSNIVELLGSELLIHTQWAGATVIAKISTGTLVKPHTEVELTMNREKILVFDENCGDTI
ncbi:MAG: TOBE domain-containing protein [Clostridia bacterium]|nr:TOBE domain-containing protein [Clostridia bacterium]